LRQIVQLFGFFQSGKKIISPHPRAVCIDNQTKGLQNGHLQIIYFEWDGKGRWLQLTTVPENKKREQVPAVQT
jgi:hypothetical protein